MPGARDLAVDLSDAIHDTCLKLSCWKWDGELFQGLSGKSSDGAT